MEVLCYICKKKLVTPVRAFNTQNQSIHGQEISCSYCGKYQITQEAINLKIHEMYSKQSYLLSAAILKKSEINEMLLLTTGSIPEIIKSIKRKPPLETIDDILEYVSKKVDSINDWIEFSENDIPRFILTNDSEFFEYVLQIGKLNYWEFDRKDPKDNGKIAVVKLTLDGWKKIDELRKTKKDSNQAFVAMWFNDFMDQYYFEGIKPALEKTGFSPIIRVKEIPHNEQIDNLIISNIRRSGLLVADFTGNRAAVYYEAGFAKGLNIDVIWTCMESDKKKLCLDTRQYSHIFWKDANDLREQLINKIAATIPGHISK